MNRQDRRFRRSPRTATPLALAVIASITASSCAMPEPPARVALVYGVSNYVEVWNGPSTSNPNLSLTDDDAYAMASMLRLKGWAVTERIADSGTDPAINALASKSQVAADIAGLKGMTGQVLFYYSGHGVTLEGDTAICPYGSVVPNASNDGFRLNESACLSSAELYAMLEAAGIEHAVVVIDACHSGGFVRKGPTVDAVPPIYGINDTEGEIAYSYFVDATSEAIKGYFGYAAGSRYVALSAAGAGELSWESTNLGHGIFTYALLKAGESAKADLDGDGYVGTGELYLVAKTIVDEIWNSPNATYTEYVNGSYQYIDYHPHLSGTAREYALWAVR